MWGIRDLKATGLPAAAQYGMEGAAKGREERSNPKIAFDVQGAPDLNLLVLSSSAKGRGFLT